MSNQVIDGSICKCNLGSAISLLLAARVHSFRLSGRRVAVTTDTHFYTPFGVCTATQALCSFKPVGEWQGVTRTLYIGGLQTLTDDAKLQCSVGGEITVVFTGQTIVDIEPNQGILTCNRKTDFKVGNHQYFYDPQLNTSCGYGDLFGKEKGPSIDDCTLIPGSQGREEEIMNKCEELAKSERFSNDLKWFGGYLPGVDENDCHELADQVMRTVEGITPVDVPRFGEPGRFLNNNGDWEKMP